jgi:hypothetical protein
MSPEEIAYLKDLQGFIVYSLTHKTSRPFLLVLYFIIHDIVGILCKDPRFLPRSSGYSKHLKKE